MGATYWLFVVLIAGFLALEERLNRIVILLTDISATLREIKNKQS